MAKSKNEELQKKLFLERKSSWTKLNSKEVFQFSESYKEWISKNKTERLCVKNMVEELKRKGFKEVGSLTSAKTGDKIYKNIKEKAVLAAVMGKDNSQIQLIGSHIDSPRLDLKPQPVYEDAGLALFKTHYYGGIKKYHWVNLPLALHGVIITKAGKKIFLDIGEREEEPKFIIPDLLPHLARKQMEKKASEVVEGEELNIVVGNVPVDDEKIKEQVKLGVLKHLNEKYGLLEEDFVTAELELVPAGKAYDVGFDKSMITAYGQDGKVCAFISLKALLEIKNPPHLVVAFFVDKEEIGSKGDTGADSFILESFVQDLIRLLNLKIQPLHLLEKSNALSADVTTAMDPNYKDVYDPHNTSELGKGVSVEKYGGIGGKFMAHDTSAEYLAYVRQLLDKNKIPWQTGLLGKVDIGGGGTIGMFLSQFGMNCVDAGPSLLGMHSPYEVSSKADLYSAYLFYKVFWEN